MSESTQEDRPHSKDTSAPAKKSVAKKAAKKAAAKSTTKTTVKKVAAKKTTAKKTAAVKVAAVKVAPVKAAAKKATAKKAVAKKAVPTPSSEPTQLATQAPKAQPTPRKPRVATVETQTQAPPRERDSNAQSTPSPQPKPSPRDQSSDQNEQPQRMMGRVKGGGRVQQSDESRNNQNNQNNQNNHRNRPRGKNRSRNNNNRNRDQNNRQDQNGRNERNDRNDRNNRQDQNNRNDRHDRQDHDDRKPVELTGPPVEVNGMLELAAKGFGFLRELKNGLEQSNNDVFVSPDLIRTHGLRLGVWIHGIAKQGPRGLQMTEITTVNKLSPDEARKLPHFDELKAVNPNKRIPFETTAERFTTRVLDIISPIGRGQRGLIVSPPRSGKTTIMLHMAEAIREKYEESMHLMVLLVDERPEEVTEFKRTLPGAEIYASSNDAGAKNHCRVAELCIERAKRLVEAGEHVFLLMDSITRLARSYNTTMGGNKNERGRGIQSGGLISGALEMPRRLFASARNTRNAGSLTIIATALINTNSRADEAIFQEFKGTGNMELVLDRRIAEQYIYPAVDIFKSGTRREELLLPEHLLHKIHLIRRGLSGHRPSEAMERLIFFLKRFHNNAQMLLEIKG